MLFSIKSSVNPLCFYLNNKYLNFFYLFIKESIIINFLLNI